MRIRKLCSVTHQAAGFGIRAQGIDHWHGMARGQGDELYATVDEEVVGMDHKCVSPPLHEARKGRVDLSSRAGGEKLDLRTNGRRRSLHIFLQRFSSRILRIDEYPKVRGCRQQLVQEPEPLGYQLVAHGVDTGDVAARSAEALDKAELDRVQAEAEDDRNRRGCGFGRERRGRAARCGDDSYPAADEIGHQFRKSGKVVPCPAVFNCYVLTLDVAGFAQSFAERCQQARRRLRRIRMHISDDRNARLLRARRERPKKRSRRRRTAEQRYELAALHSTTSSASASTVGGISRPSAFAVFRLMTNSNLVGRWIGRSAGLAPFRILSI